MKEYLCCVCGEDLGDLGWNNPDPGLNAHWDEWAEKYWCCPCWDKIEQKKSEKAKLKLLSEMRKGVFSQPELYRARIDAIEKKMKNIQKFQIMRKSDLNADEKELLLGLARMAMQLASTKQGP